MTFNEWVDQNLGTVTGLLNETSLMRIERVLQQAYRAGYEQGRYRREEDDKREGAINAALASGHQNI